ncbi:MAG: hypothetical protein ABSD63_02700 [Candidatus Korobacteraceae bacterium]
MTTRLANRQEPFNLWRSAERTIPPEADAFFEMSVWAYQLALLIDAIEERLGKEIAVAVLRQIEILYQRQEGGRAILRFMALVGKGRAGYLEEPLRAPNEPQTVAPVELHIALELMRSSGESEEKKQALLWDLAYFLDCGRIVAEPRFKLLAERLRFDPKSVVGLRTST